MKQTQQKTVLPKAVATAVGGQNSYIYLQMVLLLVSRPCRLTWLGQTFVRHILKDLVRRQTLLWARKRARSYPASKTTWSDLGNRVPWVWLQSNFGLTP